MALIKCPECGREVSDSAATCPNCGYGIAALKDRNVVKIKISVCANANSADARITIFDITHPSIIYAEVHPGEIAKFNLDSDRTIGIRFGIFKKASVTKLVSPGKKYQVFWSANSTFLALPQIKSCVEVDEFSDVASGEKQPSTSWFVSW